MVQPASFALLFVALVLAPAASAQTRVDLFDTKSNRTGGVILDQRTGRVDVYDRDANRVGYGQVDRATGRVDFYDVRGTRVGSGSITPSGATLKR